MTAALKAMVLGPDGQEWATAPDETWHLRDDPWPPIGQLVETCFAGRRPAGNYGQFGFFRSRLIEFHGDGTSSWETEGGDRMAFNPDFWRPIHD